MNGGKSLKQLAQETGINYSTLRGYVRRFKEYIPTYKVDGMRWELYENQAHDILLFIAEQYAQEKHVHEIRIALEAAGYAVTIDADTDDDEVMSRYDESGVSLSMSGNSLADDVVMSLRHALSVSMDTLKHYETLTKTHMTLIEGQSAAIDALNAEIADLKAKLERSAEDEED